MRAQGSDFIENATFISAVQGAGATVQLRAIRQAAYSDVQAFRGLRGRTGARRQELERISDQLQGLEQAVLQRVKSSAEFGLLVLSMRAESFHQALYESMGLAGRSSGGGADAGGPRRRSAPS